MEAEMATVSAQNRWRSKNRFVKSQLNVMARRLVHDFTERSNDEWEVWHEDAHKCHDGVAWSWDR